MKKVLIKIVSIASLIIIIFCSTIFATEREELEQKKEGLQEKYDEANEEHKEIQLQLTDTLKKIQELNEKISGYESELDVLSEELSQLQTQIKETQEKLDVLTKNYEAQKDGLEKRLVALYKSGETTYLDVLLNSSSVSDFISNYFLIEELAQYDADLLDTIEKDKISIETIKQTLDDKEKELVAKKESKEKATITLANSRTIQNNYKNQLSEEEKATEEKMEQYEKELKQVENEITSIALKNLGSEYAGGELAWPTPGYSTITSPFGTRLHPVLGYYKFHSGIDIGAPSGATIIATNDGTVVQSGYVGAYGNMVMINHGGGIVTVYGHGSKLLVTVGQKVTRGTAIMKVGSTGLSTGPHLHFEVRVNGSYKNPMDYLT